MRDKVTLLAAWRTTTDPEMMPLLRVLRSRIESLRSVEQVQKDGMEIFKRCDCIFLQVEIRRDHVNLDLWLPEERIEEARATGLGRTHPFVPDAIKVRFERAEDLTKVTSWLEESHRYAEVRALRSEQPEETEATVEAPEEATVSDEPAADVGETDERVDGRDKLEGKQKLSTGDERTDRSGQLRAEARARKTSTSSKSSKPRAVTEDASGKRAPRTASGKTTTAASANARKTTTSERARASGKPGSPEPRAKTPPPRRAKTSASTSAMASKGRKASRS